MAPTTFVIAKAPAAGSSKTRLVPPLTAEQAATLQRALLVDTLATCREACADVRILHANAGEADLLRPYGPLVLQRGRGLADALSLTFADHRGGPLAIVSSDVAGTPAGALEDAFDRLAAGADVVLGPALDGGYWLIAMARHHPEPFARIPWSTPAVLGVTLERCRAAGLRVEQVAPARDLDTVVDLDFLATEIDPVRAPETAALLAAVAIGPPPDVRLTSSALQSTSPWRSVIVDRLLRDDGAELEYTYLATPRAVFVVAITRDDEMLFVRQYRHPVRDWTLEVPAGSVEDGESPLDAAQRELREETGGEAAEWQHLTTFYSSPAHLSLRSDIFLATGVVTGQATPDEMERLTVVRLPRAEAIARARRGAFSEGQTALAVLLAGAR